MGARMAPLRPTPDAQPIPVERMAGGSIVMLFAALPKELVVTLAGLALLGPSIANLAGIVVADDHREASVITFLATASGMTFLGLGSAFWGIVIGMIAYRVLPRR
jgi:benzoate membrane transport protein